MQKKAFVAMVFLIGCVAGGAASRMAVPPARASADAQHWEYLCPNNPTMDQMNEAGAQGWELATMTAFEHGSRVDTTMCFKHPIE